MLKKVRLGFVSNSSSSSFIVSKPSDVEVMKNNNIRLYDVRELLENPNIQQLKKAIVCYNEAIENIQNDDEISSILDIWSVEPVDNYQISELEKIVVEHPIGAFITESIDRDWVYDKNIQTKTMEYWND